MAIVHNAAKRKLREGDIALCFGLHHLRSSGAPMLAGAAQHDYLFMDMEHGAFAGQWCAGYRTSIAGNRRNGLLMRSTIPTGAPKLGRATTDLQLHGTARVGGAEGDQR
ncbi:MAG: hypothetical protein WA864_10005 [Acetobacteraceae bacterium]|jgi:hypothetical protein